MKKRNESEKRRRALEQAAAAYREMIYLAGDSVTADESMQWASQQLRLFAKAARVSPHELLNKKSFTEWKNSIK